MFGGIGRLKCKEGKGVVGTPLSPPLFSWLDKLGGYEVL